MLAVFARLGSAIPPAAWAADPGRRKRRCVANVFNRVSGLAGATPGTQACDAVSLAKRLQDLQAAWREALHKERASSVALRLADMLFHRPILTIPVVGEVLGVSYPAAKSAVAKLEAIGALRQVAADGAAKTYAAMGILDIVSGPEGAGGMAD